MKSATHEDAQLILKLYELRREDVMRKARNYYLFLFFPSSVDDIRAILTDRENPEPGAYFRQVTSYWEMAASLVNRGALDEDLFLDCNGEHLAVFAKVEPFLTELRQFFGPQYLSQLEQLIERMPDGKERIARFREMMKSLDPR
ncbi:MAG TPA: hypothetical protein PLL06_06760 [Acidobacteriota bacterium]|nr:hypothetical protein [Acidobacteriota bacterium]HMZ79381.1 hypothetical protein [Acidobacteriota bacterium]HNB72014.1 hypothetical protein [Acidobacteriota bacterium]HNC43651.1 hypothetical protein [Acidobacteriota bacterium]HND21838.1 hypothetical protein [Acidobacteriota bacterium]